MLLTPNECRVMTIPENRYRTRLDVALSNRSAFHEKLLLQNSHALPKAYYQQYRNTSAINPEIVTMASHPTVKMNQPHTQQPTSTQTQPQTKNPFETTQQEQSLTDIVNSIKANAKQQTQHADKTQASQPPQAVKTPSKPKTQYVWKPGHGAIEKVDKRTGEIYHLAEHIQHAA